MNNSEQTSKSRFKFIIVDDQQLALDLITDILRSNGYKNINFSRNGIDAVKKLKMESYNFIISDWNMPKMNGIELLCFIRSNKNYFNTPFLMISDEMSKEKVFYAFEEGVDAYITKPFTEKNVINAVNEILMKKSSPDPLHYKIQRLNSLKLQEKYDDAIELGETLLKKNNRSDILFILSNCYQKVFKMQKAIEALQKVLEIEQNSKAYHLLGKIFMEEEEEYDKAIEYFEKAYSLNPMNRNIVIDIGNVFLLKGDFKQASETFSSLSEKKVDMTNLARARIGAAYLDIGDLDEASSYLTDAFSPIPDTIGVFNKYAIELRKKGHLKDAVLQYQRCIKIDPENHIIIFNLARVLFDLKEYGTALKYLDKCLKIDPKFEEAKKLFQMAQDKQK